MSTPAPLADMVAFGRELHAEGLEIGPGRIVDALDALYAVDLEAVDDVYWALRQTLVSRHDQLVIFDVAFQRFFLGHRPEEQDGESHESTDEEGRGHGDDGDGDGSPERRETGASLGEELREIDFAVMSTEEFQRARVLMEAIARLRPLRVSRRRVPSRRGDRLDARRLVRASLRTGGDPLERPLRARKVVARRLVVLCDVSGSMEPYARALLLFLHAAVGSGRGVEAFAFGTRLSRLTRELAARDPEEALERATASAVDWGTGTRIGESVKQLNDVYGPRALTRGAVVVIASDGWERGDPALLGREMARLARTAYAVVWVNPLKGNADYQPLAGGMRAALPYIDRFIAGHNLRSFEELAVILAGIERRHTT